MIISLRQTRTNALLQVSSIAELDIHHLLSVSNLLYFASLKIATSFRQTFSLRYTYSPYHLPERPITIFNNMYSGRLDLVSGFLDYLAAGLLISLPICFTCIVYSCNQVYGNRYSFKYVYPVVCRCLYMLFYVSVGYILYIHMCAHVYNNNNNK